MANTQERIASIIRKNIVEIIQFELKNPHIGFISIPEVKVSKDISHAKVYVSFIDRKQIGETMKVLERSKGYIRSSLAKKIDTRRVPEIEFEVDDSYEKEARITELLKKSH